MVVRPGDQIELAVDTGTIHFFDPDTGLAIGRQPTGAPLAGAAAGDSAGSAGSAGTDNGAGTDAVQPAS
jgi:multiple sugar transport system ATP-binding protein